MTSRIQYDLRADQHKTMNRAAAIGHCADHSTHAVFFGVKIVV
jgi:hypothetical protein